MTSRTNRMSEIILRSFFFAAIALIVSISSLCTSNAHSAQTTLAWDPPVNADGTLFTGVSGYKLHVGNASRSYTQTIDVGNTTTYALNSLSDGSTYYFAVTDYDSTGNESGYSNEVSKAFPFTYSLTVTAGAGGTISPVGNVTPSTATNGTSTTTSVTVSQGGTQSFSITPNSGYTISDVAVDGISVGAITSYTFSNVTANHTMTATFAAITVTPVTYTLSASAGTGGSITPSGSATVNSGASQAYTIAPATGYKIASVTVDGVSVGAVASYTFSNITANHTMTATFAAITATPVTYTLSASAGTGGSITPYGSATVNSGASQTYTVAPATGYKIASVTVDGVSVGAVASYTFSSVTANHTIAAFFAAITYSVSATAGTGGSITPSGSTTVNSGASLSFAIAASTGYQIADVVVDGVSKGKISSYTFDRVAQDHTISATFAPPPSMKGDVDGDGKVGTGDAMTVLRAVIGATTLTADQATRADVWPIDASGTPIGDGKIDMADVLLILRRAIGLSTW